MHSPVYALILLHSAINLQTTFRILEFTVNKAPRIPIPMPYLPKQDIIMTIQFVPVLLLGSRIHPPVNIIFQDSDKNSSYADILEAPVTYSLTSAIIRAE